MNVHLVLQSGDVLVKRDICRQGWSLFRRPAGTDILMMGIMKMNLVLMATEGESTKTIQLAILACLVMGKYSLKTVGAPDGLLGAVAVQVALGGALGAEGTH